MADARWLSVVAKLLGYVRLSRAEEGKVEVHLGDRWDGGDQREMNVVARFAIQRVDEVFAVVHGRPCRRGWLPYRKTAETVFDDELYRLVLIFYLGVERVRPLPQPRSQMVGEDSAGFVAGERVRAIHAGEEPDIH